MIIHVFDLFRALKVENIQDLPEDIKKMKYLLRLPNTVKHHSKMECNQPKGKHIVSYISDIFIMQFMLSRMWPMCVSLS
jgi:hypothetical protein